MGELESKYKQFVATNRVEFISFEGKEPAMYSVKDEHRSKPSNQVRTCGPSALTAVQLQIRDVRQLVHPDSIEDVIRSKHVALKHLKHKPTHHAVRCVQCCIAH